MTDRLRGRVALVTGAGRGIGRAHAFALAALGATVVVNDVADGPAAGDAENPAAQVVDEIERAGGHAVADTTAVGTWDAAESIVGAAVERFGRLDIVVANAGILRPRTIVGMSADEWSDVLRVHLDGTFTLTRAVARHWRQRAKAGDPLPARLVTTTSPAGLFGGGGQANYAAAKAGIVALTQVAAAELARYGATANAVAPVALTRMSEGMAGPDHRPEHAARLAAWLCTDAAADVTGEVFLVGGGHVSVVARPHAGPGADDIAALDDLDAVVPDLLERAGPHPGLLGQPFGRSVPSALSGIRVPADVPQSSARMRRPAGPAPP